MKPTIVTITGPSCAGKSTLEARLQDQGFARAISTTTRQKREGDIDNETYYFVSRSLFEAGIDFGEDLIEHVEFGGNYYGVTKNEIERLAAMGKPIVLVCEPVGQKQIVKFAKEHDWNLVLVFVSGSDASIAERFLRRFADEVMRDTQTGSEKQVATYARRMEEMMTTEREWITEAYLSRGWYDIVVDQFDASTEKGVIQGIKRLTKSL